MTILKLANPGVQKLTPYSPGKPLDALKREYGIDDAIKLASNESPLGPSITALKAIEQALPELHRYPDGNGFELKSALAKRHGLSVEQITLGNGSNDILELVARCFVMPEQGVLFSEHAFAVYPIVTMAVNGLIQAVPALPKTHAQSPYGHDLDAMLIAIDERTRVIFVANPNNPTGTWLTRDALRVFIEQVPSNIIVVVDEAYFEYVEHADYPNAIEWVNEFENLMVTRTFSKAYGLPGVRVGYGVSQAGLADCLNRARQPFNVNSLAQTAALAALSDEQYVDEAIQTNKEGMQALTAAFDELSLPYIPSVGNFVCVDLASTTNKTADEVYQGLLHAGVIVRPVANYGLPNYLRISIGTARENQRFINALRAIIRP